MAETSSTKRSHRIFALTMAILFLVTASALTIAVILQMIDQHNQNSSSASQSAQQNAAQSAQQNKLQGTKLAGFTPVSDVPQLKVTDIKVGSGAAAKAGDTVNVDYTGAVASTGIIFQSSKDSGQPVSLDLNNVIKGWQQGIPGMKVGGARQLLIPANLAYGANPPQGSGIPANAALVFDITLHKIGS